MKRYDLDWRHEAMEESEIGDYVKYEDVLPLIKALQFYADKRTWNREMHDDVARSIIANDLEEVKGYAKYCGGSIARKALEEIE